MLNGMVVWFDGMLTVSDGWPDTNTLIQGVLGFEFGVLKPFAPRGRLARCSPESPYPPCPYWGPSVSDYPKVCIVRHSGLCDIY